MSGGWKFTVQRESWWHCWENILFSPDRISVPHLFFESIRFFESILRRRFALGLHHCRRLYAGTVLRSTMVSPMFPGKKSLIWPVGSWDIVPSSVFLCIFWEMLSINTRGQNRHQREQNRSIHFSTVFLGNHTCILKIFFGSVTPGNATPANGRHSIFTIYWEHSLFIESIDLRVIWGCWRAGRRSVLVWNGSKRSPDTVGALCCPGDTHNHQKLAQQPRGSTDFLRAFTIYWEHRP